MKSLAVSVTLILLLLAAWQDSKEKQFYLAFPVAIFLLNAIVNLYENGTVMTTPDIILGVIMILYSLLSGQKLGLGDALIMVALLPLCSIYGCIRIFVDGVLLVNIFRVIRHRKNDSESSEIAFVPFMAISYFIWILI